MKALDKLGISEERQKIFLSVLLSSFFLIKPCFAATISDCSNLDTAGETYYLTADIINSSSTYCMNISANNVILDCQGHNIDGKDTTNTYGIYINRSSSTNTNITIKNCNVTDWYYGIYLYYANNNTISNSTANSNGYGIYISSSSNNTISNSTANSNGYGIYISSSSNYNTITNNTANSNSYGIYISSSSNNILRNNTASSNSNHGIHLYLSSNNILRNNSIQASHTSSSKQQGLFVYGSSISYFKNDIDESNTINGLPVLYIDGSVRPCVNNTVYTNGSSYSYMGFVGCSNITIKYSSPTDHILLAGTTNSTISGLSISYTVYAIYLVVGANYNTISNNTLNSNSNSGIYITLSSNYNTITNNTANSNYYGIYLYSSSNNTITNNTANSNSYGIYLYSSSNYNTIYNNVIQGNTQYGIYLYSASSNTIYNNLFNNTRNFYFSGTIYSNYWNTTRQEGKRIYSPGKEIGGNYWTNPSGNGYSDTCTDADQDGFCDTLYTLNETGPNIDYLPLSNKYSAADTTPPTYSLNSTNSTIAGTAVSHNLFWQDNVGLSHAIFSFDNCTGSFQNISEMDLSGTSAWSNFTVVINETVGCTIRWCVYANDTSNNWNVSEIYTYTTSCSVAIGLSNTLASGIFWNVNSLPAINLPAEGNDGVTQYNITISIAGSCKADLYIKASGDLTSNGNKIGLGNETYCYNTTDATVPGIDCYQLDTDYSGNRIGSDLADGSYVYLKFYLDVPSAQPPGIYTNTIFIKGVPSGEQP